MKNSYLSRTNIKFENAKLFQLNDIALPYYRPVDETAKLVFKLFRLLPNEEDHSVVESKRSLWGLRNTIYESPLPFNDPRLKLSSQVDDIINFFQGQSLDDENLTTTLSEAVKFLAQNSENPKRQQLLKHLNSHPPDRAVGIIVKSSHRELPGCEANVWEEVFGIYPNLRFLDSTSQLGKSHFDEIVIPFNGRFCPLIHESYTAYRSKSLCHLHYQTEGARKPTFSRRPNVKSLSHSKKVAERVIGEVHDETMNHWADRDFWSTIKTNFSNHIATHETSSSAKVPARLCIFQSGKAAFFGEQKKYIEISEVLERSFDKLLRLPRKFPCELKRNDMVLLRTEGSGDYLIDVADDLLRRDKKTTLRDSSIIWKKALLECLQIKGPEWIAHELEQRGEHIRDHNYIRFWSTNYVMRPHKKELFDKLIGSIRNFLGDKKLDLEGFTQLKWNEMNEVLRYHHSAGRLIRRELLGCLRELIAESGLSDDETIITIGSSSGSLTVFTVISIEENVELVPYTIIGEVR